MLRSVSTKRCSVSSEASSIGVWDVPSPSTILAIRLSSFYFLAPSPLSSPRRRGPITTGRSIFHPWLPHCFATAYGSPPSRGRQLPCNIANLHTRMRKARAHLELVTGRILVRRVSRQHDRGRAHTLMDGVDAGRRLVFLNQRLGGAHQAMACHDDAVVGRDQVLLGAVDDRTHQLLDAGILHGKPGNAAVGLAGLLGGAIDEIVVVLV